MIRHRMQQGVMKVPKHIVSCAAKCTYYRGEERHEIFCSGLNYGMGTHVAFSSPAERKQWTEEYCKSIHGHEQCPVMKMLKMNEQKK